MYWHGRSPFMRIGAPTLTGQYWSDCHLFADLSTVPMYFLPTYLSRVDFESKMTTLTDKFRSGWHHYVRTIVITNSLAIISYIGRYSSVCALFKQVVIVIGHHMQ